MNTKERKAFEAYAKNNDAVFVAAQHDDEDMLLYTLVKKSGEKLAAVALTYTRSYAQVRYSPAAKKYNNETCFNEVIRISEKQFESLRDDFILNNMISFDDYKRLYGETI